MVKEKHFKKIVEWPEVEYKGKPLTAGIFIVFILLGMIPIIGQLLLLILLFMAIGEINIYWKEIK